MAAATLAGRLKNVNIYAMRPQVSVVIKSYNHAAYVHEAIQSILDQSFQDFEIVVTDDGSTDGTADIVRRFADPRIHLEVFEQNRGISIAMNSTIARAGGEFIAILNSDDFALPGRLGRQVAFLDANSGIAGVFGLPRIVDDAGQPTNSFFDFKLPFSLPDFSRTSWLRYFFFHSNCLCAPTAMIRRSVYLQVGTYDPRLTNLQDLDMWVRICTGHDIHVMREELTAFRIRNNNKNMSAPRPDSKLRGQFEFSQILKRYRAMNAGLLREIFTADLAAKGISPDGPPDRWLAELAVTASSPAHRLFALETLFEIAQDDADFRRLRDLAGSVDVFGTSATTERDRQIASLEQRISERDRQIASLEQRISERDKVVKEILFSRSWRYTAPMRWMRLLFSPGKN
jgi:glycosyltransferase involved in cell wall biosynthesis